MAVKNPEMACGQGSCPTNPFKCKVAACDYGETVRSKESMSPGCATNGGCALEQGKTPGCLVADCYRANLTGTARETTLPSIDGKSPTMSMPIGSIEFNQARIM